jgi:hypothetical protein
MEAGKSKLRGSSGGWFAATVLLGLALLSGYLYNPSAAKRLLSLRSFDSDEARLVHFVTANSRSTDRILAFRNATLIYWLSHRLPPGRLIHTAQQTTWYLRREPEALWRTLEAPDLKLVEFNAAQVVAPTFDDPDFGRDASDRQILAELYTRLRKDFVLLSDSPAGYIFWTRGASDPFRRSISSRFMTPATSRGLE